MRRILSTAVISAAAVITAFAPAQAQITMGIQAGVNSANLKVSPEASGDGTSSYTGFMAGGWIGLHLGNMFALQLEPVYTQKGADLTFGGVEFGRIKLDQIEVPLILRVAIPILPVISPYIYGGPAIAFSVSCKFDAVVGGSSTDCDDSAGLDTEVTSTTYSGILGLGVKLSRFLIAIQYDMGLDNILVDDPTTEVKTETWTLKAGIGI